MFHIKIYDTIEEIVENITDNVMDLNETNDIDRPKENNDTSHQTSIIYRDRGLTIKDFLFTTGLIIIGVVIGICVSIFVYNKKKGKSM